MRKNKKINLQRHSKMFQEIYRQLRYKLDSSVKEFNQKQYEKLEKEIEENKR